MSSEYAFNDKTSTTKFQTNWRLSSYAQVGSLVWLQGGGEGSENFGTMSQSLLFFFKASLGEVSMALKQL